MRVAVVGWCADSGVGRELVDALRHLPVESAFILPNSSKPTRHDLVPPHVAAYYAHAEALRDQMNRWVAEALPDTVLTWEVPGSWDFPEIWKRHDIRWVHVVHWDWFAPDYVHLWREATLLAPNRFCQRELEKMGMRARYLPVPVDTDRLPFHLREKADFFISVYGYGGLQNRRSLPEIFEAWHAMGQPPPLEIRSQVPIAPLISAPHGKIRAQIGNTPEPSGLYETGDVALQPSRYEGVGVSMLEAQACGVPVIAVNAAPMNEVAPDLLVRAHRTEPYTTMGKTSTAHVPDPESIRARVEQIAFGDISDLSRKARRRVEESYSWKALKAKWIKVLEKR